MKRSFKIIVSILVVILCISSFSLMLDVFKDDDKSSGNRSPSVIVPIDPGDTEEPEEPSPEDPEPVRRVINDNETSITSIGKNHSGVLSLENGAVSYNGDTPSGSEYVDLPLVNPTGEFVKGIELVNYSRIEISLEYYYTEGDFFGFSIYLVGRDEKNESTVSKLSEIILSSEYTDENGFELFSVDTKGTDFTNCMNSVDVKYVIDVDKEYANNSIISVYYNGELCVNGIPLFENLDVKYLPSIRFKNFVDDAAGGFEIDNFTVAVYE